MTELASSLAANAIGKLGSRVYREISLAYGVESDLKNLRETMTTIHAYLLDAEDRQVKNPGLSVWLAQLKDVFYDAMNVLDSFEREVLRRQVMKTHESNIRKVRRFISSSNPLVFHNKMGHRIKKIRERLRVKADDRDLLDLVPRDDRPNVPREGETNSLLPYEVIGRDDDKQKIMDLLKDSSDVDNVSVISICGLGGIGKSTLAKYVYHDERVARHFPLKFWVYISEDLNISTLAKEILNSIGVEGIASKTDNNLQADVRKALNGIRIFMVLDNVRVLRDVDLPKWYEVKHLLDAAAKGSKIVVTTPYQNVASLMSSNPKLIFFIESLSDNDCFSLFKRRVFNEGEEKQYPTLVDIGRRIVEKCNGVPLAVTALGDFLRSKYKDDRDWVRISESEIYELDQELKQGGFILPTLKLSYDQLSSNLKPVFAYLSLYPKDYNFSSIELIQSLMANGLLGHRSETMEETGKQYLQELFARSFCKEVKDNGFYFTFKIHDLMHELSRFVAKDDHCLIGKNDSSKIYEGARHVSIFYDSLGASDEAASFLHKLSNGVRAIIFQNKDGRLININESFLEACISRFKYMRLLDLSLLSFKVLPSSIRILKLLRYLSLQGNTQIKKLPNSICDLQSLETLLLAGCKELEELPRDIRKMTSLRYLSITTKQTCLPENGIECLPSLRTLIFSDCPKLESLPNNVKHFTALRSLDFRSCDSLMSLPQVMRHMVALERLTIVGCGKLDLTEGEDYPTSLRSLVIGALPQLQDLPKLIKESATTLQFLHMYDCGNLTKLPDWVTQLTSLQKLQFWSCPKLSSLPEGMTCLTALRELEIRECPELRRYCDQEVAKDWPVIKYIDGLND